ncbi:MAG: glycosyltransferase family 4 protein [Defluviimonas sp.]|nr:glycosyltransferase family 4 protein [Defluviimonas sp.]
MRIGLLCAHNPHDRNAFSGTAHYAAAALRQMAEAGRIAEFRVLGSHRAPRRGDRVLHGIGRRLGLAPGGPAFSSPADLGQGLDWIVSLVSTGLLDRLGPRLLSPVAHVSDATPQFLRDFYGQEVPAEKDAAEARVIARAGRVIYSSDYMRDRARAEFAPEFGPRMRAIPFGVNLDRLPLAPRPAARAPAPGAPVDLVFVGKDWARKGGPLALGALACLRAEGIEARLTIAGCDPAEARGAPGVTVIPYLDKNDPAGARRFDAMLDAAHLFVLPTRADCTPMVVAEANAHSLPVLITATGGIGSLMVEGANGRMLPPEAGPGAWAAAIRETLADPAAYARLRETSFAQYRDRLNWGAWAEALVAELEAAPARMA